MIVIFEISVPRAVCMLILSVIILEFESEYEYDANFMDISENCHKTHVIKN